VSAAGECVGFSPEEFHGTVVVVFHGRRAAPPPSEVYHGAVVAVLFGRSAAPPTWYNDDESRSSSGLPQPPKSKAEALYFIGVSSRLLAPSGFVLDGVEVGSGELYGGGSGPGLDGVFSFQSKVLVQNVMGRFVILFFFRTLSVIVPPPLIME
jgi:hypothetical protein